MTATKRTAKQADKTDAAKAEIDAKAKAEALAKEEAEAKAKADARAKSALENPERTTVVILKTGFHDSELDCTFTVGDDYPCDEETAARLCKRNMAKPKG